jgi:RNA polymerase sigma-70 factor (ECF subfamily)
MLTASALHERSAHGSALLSVGTQDDADLDLVARMKCGDEQALGALYDRWVDKVYSIASHLVADSDGAEEVVEQTFSQVWRDAHRFDRSRGSVGSWIIAIARSESLTRRRNFARAARHDQLRAEYSINKA